MIPNNDTALNTATSHHNKLGLSNNKVELLVVRARNGRVIVAESTGAQNITAYTKRDQERPKRDAFVGMLPPKLAQIMINLANPAPEARILDPFCGTGVVLQEAALLGHPVYGTDLSEKMIRYSKENLDWLKETHRATFEYDLHEGDAMDTSWQGPIGAVVGETYLGQPFSAPPSPAKLDQVRGNCNNIISAFLKNLASQIPAGTPVSIAVPAWKRIDGGFVHLPLINQLDQLGFTRHSFKNIKDHELLYFREDQVVARELLVLVKA
jgi:tRNA (guanine10-N2)-dimethyltransferase